MPIHGSPAPCLILGGVDRRLAKDISRITQSEHQQSAHESDGNVGLASAVKFLTNGSTGLTNWHGPTSEWIRDQPLYCVFVGAARSQLNPSSERDQVFGMGD